MRLKKSNKAIVAGRTDGTLAIVPTAPPTVPQRAAEPSAIVPAVGDTNGMTAIGLMTQIANLMSAVQHTAE